MADADALEAKLEDKTAVIGVLGLGYVGLPLAREFAESGFTVLGFDTDPGKITRLEQGDSYIQAVPTPVLVELRSAGKFSATGDFSRLAEVDAMLICVPTPLDSNREPDMSYIEATGRTIGDRLRVGQLVVLESTTWPGTTRDFLAPILETRSGLKRSRDFFIGYSPERENPGDAKWRTRDIPKVVGADDPSSAKVSQALYRGVVTRVVPVSSSLVAEASKLLENIYRAVNIALVNELKILFERMGIDVFEVIGASKTKPFGFKAFYPGPGLGGHCIPIDPFYLSWKAREFEMSTRFIELAGEINTGMPRYVIERCQLALNAQKKAVNGSRILVLGVAYKEDVDDLRESPALAIIDGLRELGADVCYHDPHIPTLPRTRRHNCEGLASVELDAETLATIDLALVVTNHRAVELEPVIAAVPGLVDTRNATAAISDPALMAKITRA